MLDVKYKELGGSGLVTTPLNMVPNLSECNVSHAGIALGQNGNDILLQIVGCSIIKYFAQFVGFVISPNVPCCCILFL